MMDAGCYTISTIRYFCDLMGKTTDDFLIDETEVMKKKEKIDIDLSMEVGMTLPRGVKAKIVANFADAAVLPTANINIELENSTIELKNFLWPHKYHLLTIKINNTEFVLEEKAETAKEISTYELQLFEWARVIRSNDDNNSTVLNDTYNAVEYMKLIDRIYESAGMRKRGEEES